jgi:hypothetical protein
LQEIITCKKNVILKKKTMVTLRRPNRYSRGSGFSTKYLALLIGATMALVIWAFQQIYFEEPSSWMLFVAIGMAAWAFGLAIFHIVAVWQKQKEQKTKLNDKGTV